MATLDKPTSASTSPDLVSEHSDVEWEEADSDWQSDHSDDDELSATKLALTLDYFLAWEFIHNCNQAAYSDIPSKYLYCLSVFDTKDSAVEQNFLPHKQLLSDEKYDTIFEVSGATKTTSDPWSLPIPIKPEFALYPSWVRISEVSQVFPTAAIYVNVNDAAMDDVNYSHVSQEARPPTTALGTFDSNMSPLVHAAVPCFASTVFAAASHIAPHKYITHSQLRGYNRLATTSLLRQAYTLKVDTPVFGVLLIKNLVAIHIDWYEECDGVVEFFSAFYPLDDEEIDIKIWDLDQPSEERELLVILSNLRRFTYDQLASMVRLQFGSVRHPITPWKWNASIFSGILTKAHLVQSPEESSEDRLERWQNGLEIPEASVSESLLSESGQASRLETCKDLLSPPSTPGEVSRGD